MISKHMTIGMKVVPISKSVGQDFADWTREYFLPAKYVVVEKLIVHDYRDYTPYWECSIPGTIFVGHFKAKDLVPYQE